MFLISSVNLPWGDLRLLPLILLLLPSRRGQPPPCHNLLSRSYRDLGDPYRIYFPSQEQLEEYKSGCDLEEGWVLVCKHAEGGDRLVPVESTERIQRQQQLFGVDYKPVIRYGVVADLFPST